MTWIEALDKAAQKRGCFDFTDLKISMPSLEMVCINEAAELYANAKAEAKWNEAIEEMRCISELDSDVEIPKFEP